MVLPQEKMKEQLQQVGGGGGQAITHPLPPEAAVNSPAPSSGNTVAPNGAAPALAGANESQGGAGDVDLTQDRGTPDEIIKKIGPTEGLNIATQSAQAVGNTGATADNKEASDQKTQVNESMAAQGMNPKDTFDELVKENVKQLKALREGNQITPEHHDELKSRWKNIYNIVPKEDMGLFLMDFGFRLMMAGESMGDLGAIGAAGSGALSAQQGRRQATSDRAVADQQAATEMATDEYGAISDRITAEARADTASLYGRGYQGEKAWLLDLGEKWGKSPEEIWGMFNKEDSEQIRRDKAFEFIRDIQAEAGITDTDPMLGKKYRDFTADDFVTWVNMVMEQEKKSREQGALPENSTGTALERYGDKANP